MNQNRITAVSAALAAVACIVACGLLWQLLAQSDQHHRELLDRLRATTAGAQETNAGVESEEAQPLQVTTWVPIQVRLVNLGGEPVSGTVRLTGDTFSGGSLQELVETDAAGIADFGRIPPGDYETWYHVDEPDVESRSSILVGPGGPGEIEVTCPSDPGEFTIAFDIQTPERLVDIPLYYLAPLDYESLEFNGDTWPYDGGKGPVLVLDGSGNILGQASYYDITYRDEDPPGPAFSTHFVEELPAEFTLEPVDTLPAFEFNVELRPLVRAPDATQPETGDRPLLRRLTGAALRDVPDQEPTPGELHTVPVGEDYTEFWAAVSDDLRRIDEYAALLPTTPNSSERLETNDE